MSETPKLWVKRGGYRPGDGPTEEWFEPADDDDLRAAVVPLLDYEAAMECESLHGFTELSRRLIVEDVVYAALGLGEES